MVIWIRFWIGFNRTISLFIIGELVDVYRLITIIISMWSLTHVIPFMVSRLGKFSCYWTFVFI